MAAKERVGEDDASTLNATFSQCEAVVTDLESLTATADPAAVRETVGKLEELTRRVSSLGLFSPNESADELPTAHLRFLLLPFYLAVLTQHVRDAGRAQALRTAEIYTKDFLSRLRSYEVVKEALAWQPDAPATPAADPAARREMKIQSFRLEQQYEAQLKKYDSEGDEDGLRDHYLTKLRYCALRAKQQLEDIERELPMAVRMEAQATGGGEAAAERPAERPPAAQALRPVIITRDVLQKQVFGAGYPSLPTLTVDEWYDQMVREGWFGGAATANQNVAAPQPEAVDTDANDDAELQRARLWDEYKDDHRRGWGNTHNKG